MAAKKKKKSMMDIPMPAPLGDAEDIPMDEQDTMALPGMEPDPSMQDDGGEDMLPPNKRAKVAEIASSTDDSSGGYESLLSDVAEVKSKKSAEDEQRNKVQKRLARMARRGGYANG